MRADSLVFFIIIIRLQKKSSMWLAHTRDVCLCVSVFQYIFCGFVECVCDSMLLFAFVTDAPFPIRMPRRQFCDDSFLLKWFGPRNELKTHCCI